jgi:ABC-2 type transport system permease protein
VALGAGLAALDILLAGWICNRVCRHAVRTGLIARYSVESVRQRGVFVSELFGSNS